LALLFPPPEGKFSRACPERAGTAMYEKRGGNAKSRLLLFEKEQAAWHYAM
jgi:hypothetical protein